MDEAERNHADNIRRIRSEGIVRMQADNARAKADPAGVAQARVTARTLLSGKSARR